MAKKRYMNTRDQSFFGNYLYDQMVSPDHFLRLLNVIIEWEHFTQHLIELYRGGGEYGRPPFNPAQLLKMCLLAYFYDLSERQVEVYVNENIPAKYFVGLGLDQSAPDHSTLSRFRERLTQQGNLKIFEQLLAEIVQIAVKSGIQLGSIQVIDSVHSEANVNTGKDHQRKEDGKGPHDPDAKWGVKGKRVTKPFWITTSRPVKGMADRMGYTEIIEAAGAQFATDTCCVVAPIKGRFHALATDSAKACYYAYAKNAFKTRLLPFDEVVREATL